MIAASANGRTADHPIEPFFLDRLSPRAFRPQPIAEADLMTMLEAARWAASSSNMQPWRFVYARRETRAWLPLLDLLVRNNRDWAQHSSALVFFVSHGFMQSRSSVDLIPAPTHSYDTGTASGYFALQARLMGWHAHGMYGFDHVRSAEVLRTPPHHHVEAAYAVGRIGNSAALPKALQGREVPSGRLPLAELVHEGNFS